MEEREPSYTVGGNVQPQWKRVWGLIKHGLYSKYFIITINEV